MFPRRVLAQTAKTREGTLEPPAYRVEYFTVAGKISIFEEHGSQRIAEKYAKDSKVRWGSINTRRILGAESLPSGSESAYSFQDKFKFICWQIASKSIRSGVRMVDTGITHRGLWGNLHCSSGSFKKLTLLIDVFDRKTRPHFNRLSDTNQA